MCYFFLNDREKPFYSSVLTLNMTPAELKGERKFLKEEINKMYSLSQSSHTV